jgi:hypothetical protein
MTSRILSCLNCGKISLFLSFSCEIELISMGVFGRASTSASQKLFSASPAKDEAENTIFF